jgi:hypothetical protein
MRKFTPLDVIFWVIVLAIVFMVVRPGSKAGAGLIAVTNAFAAVVGTATGAEARGS